VESYIKIDIIICIIISITMNTNNCGSMSVLFNSPKKETIPITEEVSSIYDDMFCINDIYVDEYTLVKYPKIIEYLECMSPLEKKACIIAQKHLKTSFDLTRSNGFTEWLKSSGSSL
jgi:hypothetical protein